MGLLLLYYVKIADNCRVQQTKAAYSLDFPVHDLMSPDLMVRDALIDQPETGIGQLSA